MSARKNKKEKQKKKNVKSGMGLGNSKKIPVSFAEFTKDDHCTSCNYLFSHLATKSGNDRLCMDCFTEKYGSGMTMEEMKALNNEQQLSWERKLDPLKLKDYFYSSKYGSDKVEDVLLNFIASAVDVLIVNESIKMCKEGKCSGDYIRALNIENKELQDGLLQCSNELLTDMIKKGSGLFGDDPEFGEYIEEKVYDQMTGLEKEGYSYLKYLLTFFNHFKHTHYAHNTVGEFKSNKVYDISNFEIVPCPYSEKKFTDDDIDVISKFSKMILSNRDFYDEDDQELNQFNLDFEDGSNDNDCLMILKKFHEGTDHSELAIIEDDGHKFLKENGYVLDWDGLEEQKLQLTYCATCRVLYPIPRDVINRWKQEEWAEKNSKKSKQIEVSKSDIKHEKKVEKIKKEKPKFLEADKAILKLAEMNIKNQAKLDKAKKKGHATNIPNVPLKHYGKKFSWKLVREVKRKKSDRSFDDVELAIRNLRTHWKFYMRKPDAFFITLFDDWGLFDLKDPYKQRFFSEFVTLRHTVAGRRQLLEVLSSGKFDMMFGHFPKQVPSSQSVNLASPHTTLYSADVTNTEDEFSFAKLLEDEREAGVHQILSETDSLIPMDKDSRAFKLHVRMIIQELWLSVMKDGEKEVNKFQKWKKESKSILTETVMSTFLAEFKLIKMLKEEIIHSDYRGEEPNMMQLYTAFMIRAKRGFGNFSSTGSGKTKSVVLGSRLSGAKNTLIFTPAPVMKQFGEMILADYPLSYISISKHSKDKIFPEAPVKKAFRYHIMNYEKISRDEQANDLIDRICETDVDMVIFDEAHLFKQRDEEQQSNTRKNIEILLERLRENKPNLKAVFLTATPIINNLTEGVKLLEMIANKKYPHLKTTNHVRNGSRLYMELLQYSLRFIRDYKINLKEIPIETQVNLPMTWDAKQVRSTNYSGWEILCTPSRIPEIVKIVKKHGKAIIYTDYVSKVVELLEEGLKKEGIRVGTFTGQKDGKEGLVKKTEVRGVTTNPFANGDIDVLIASSPIALGIDGLQKVCNCMIFNGLTWTWGKYEQIIGRLEREGQTEKDVYIYKILTTIETFEYDKKIRLERIYYKHMIQMCAIDGKIPDLGSWKKQETESKKGYQDFLEAILRDRRTRVQTKAQLKKAGVQEMEE